MAYSTAEARTSMLEDTSAAADELAAALACLSEAYDALDDDHADALERGVFRPVQAGYARLGRAQAEFAGRHGLAEHRSAAGSSGAHTADPRVYLERALAAVQAADQRIAELQDSMLPVEVGDPALRAGLSETRALLDGVPLVARRLLSTVGR